MMQPITNETGEVIDEYDDEQPAVPLETDALSQHEPRAQNAADPGDLVDAATSPLGPASLKTQAKNVLAEDPTNFEQSDVKIEILLHRTTGEQTQGRRVSVLIHNFSGSPIVQDFREADLTDKARLDSMQRAIYPVLQRFLLELSGRTQKNLAAAAKRVPRTAPASNLVPPGKATPPAPLQVGPAAPPSVPSFSPAPLSPAFPPSARTATVSAVAKEGGPKKSAKEAGKTGLYQSIPLF